MIRTSRANDEGEPSPDGPLAVRRAPARDALVKLLLAASCLACPVLLLSRVDSMRGSIAPRGLPFPWGWQASRGAVVRRRGCGYPYGNPGPRSTTIGAMKRTVLIVDDHAGFRASARRVLEAERLFGDRRGRGRQLGRDARPPSPARTSRWSTCSCRTSTASRSRGACANRRRARGRADLEPRAVRLRLADREQRRPRLRAEVGPLRRRAGGAAAVSGARARLAALSPAELRRLLIGARRADARRTARSRSGSPSTTDQDHRPGGRAGGGPGDRLVVRRHRAVRLVAAAREPLSAP